MTPNREEMIQALWERDLNAIREDMAKGDTDYLCAILHGDGFTQYNNLSDEQLQEADEGDDLPCLREIEPDADPQWTCVNDHTGCMWNNGHNGCNHEGNNTQPLES